MDVDGEDDAADDVQQVVDGQVLRDGIVDGRGSGGGRIEPGGGIRSGWRRRPVEWVDLDHLWGPIPSYSYHLLNGWTSSWEGGRKRLMVGRLITCLEDMDLQDYENIVCKYSDFWRSWCWEG